MNTFYFDSQQNRLNPSNAAQAFFRGHFETFAFVGEPGSAFEHLQQQVTQCGRKVIVVDRPTDGAGVVASDKQEMIQRMVSSVIAEQLEGAFERITADAHASLNSEVSSAFINQLMAELNSHKSRAAGCPSDLSQCEDHFETVLQSTN